MFSVQPSLPYAWQMLFCNLIFTLHWPLLRSAPKVKYWHALLSLFVNNETGL